MNSSEGLVLSGRTCGANACSTRGTTLHCAEPVYVVGQPGPVW